MSNINLRLYGEQLYPNISKYLTKYISPEISKEDFLSSYKNGILEIKSLKLKEKLLIHPQILIEDTFIEEVKINIPDDKSNLEIYLNNIKCNLSVSELNEEEVEKIMINDRKKIIDDFIKYAINKIEKKDGLSFLDNIFKSIIEKIFNGCIIDINNLELKISAKNRDNIYFIFNIDNTNFSFDTGFKIKNMNLLYQENNIKKTVLDKFDFNMDIIYKNEEKSEKNKLNFYASEVKLEINKKIYFEFLNIYNIIFDVEYTKIYLLYKKLIQFYRPNNKNNEKKDYKSLWKYSIKTIIKLQKYVQKNIENIFDLNYLNQIKLIKDYLNDNKNDENIILPNIDIALKNTKETVEKKVLENKKGNFLTQSFSFFFGKKEDDKKEELSEEEKQISSEIYNDENINKYLDEKSNLDLALFSSIFDRMKLFFIEFSVEINFEKLELTLESSLKKQDLFIKRIKFDFNYFNKEFDFSFSINDIGYDKGKTIFQKDQLFFDDAIALEKNKQNFINLKFGFQHAEVKEELFIFFFSFIKEIKTKTRIKLFHEKKRGEFFDENKKEEIIQNLQNFSFINNFKLSNIPSFSIRSQNNKIDFKVSDYSINENSLNFNINIKDSYSTILNNFSFNSKKENNKYILHFDTPIDINLSNVSSRIFLINYLKYQKELSVDNSNNKSSEKKTKNELFGFHYNSYKNLDLGNINMNDYTVDFIINKININILEEKENYKSSFTLEEFKILYQNKNLDINLKKIIISANLMSTIFLYMIDFESPLLEKIKKENLIIEDNKDIHSMISNEIQEIKKEESEQKLQINEHINYTKLLENILNDFNFNLEAFIFNYQSNNFVLSINFNNIKVLKQKIDDKINLNSSIESWNLCIDSPKINVMNKKFIQNNQTSFVNYDFKDEIVKGTFKSIYFDMTMEIVFDFWDNTKFLLNQINWDIILCKMDFKVDDFVLKLDQFKYSISKILFLNFKESGEEVNAFFFKLFEFVMSNQKEYKIIYEKELDIEYYFTSSIENDITIILNNPNVEISQKDITFLLSQIKPQKKKEEEKISRNATSILSKSTFQTKRENKIILDDTKDTNNLSTNSLNRMSLIGETLQKKKKFSLSLNIIIPKLSLSFCLNHKSKIEEMIIESSNIKLKNIFYENTFNNESNNEFSYGIFLGKLNFTFFYSEEKFINILSKRTDLKENITSNENIIKEEKENINQEKNKNINQVEIISNPNGFKININKNDINIRIDAFIMIYYYFKGAIPIDEIIDNFGQADLGIKDNKSFFQVEITFNDSQFKLCTSFNGDENLFLDINKFFIIYTSNKGLPYGSYMFTVNRISSKINSKNYFRDIFFTNNDFLQIKLILTEELFSANILLDQLTIKLSYMDLVSFYAAYILNFKMLEESMKRGDALLNNKNQGNKNNNNDLNKIEQVTPNEFFWKKMLFTGELNFEKFDLTFIDNSKGSYQPFMNMINNKIYLVFNPDKSLEASFSFLLFSYNYLACIWEPTIEKTMIKFTSSYSKKGIDINNNMGLEINNININLSDMAISFTLMSLNNWIEKFIEEEKKFKNKKINAKYESKNENKEISKITNNKVINYTGVEFKIIHNGKTLDCPLYKPVELEYIISEYNKTNITKRKNYHFTLVYDEKIKFEIPLEKIITLQHWIDRKNSFISNNMLSENRTINIALFSTIIFKNKTIHPLKLIIENNNTNLASIDLNPNSISGIPLNLINEKNDFQFLLKDDENSDDFSQIFNIGSIQSLNLDFEYKDKIKFKNKCLFMKLDDSIGNVRTILINNDINIINGLPCDLTVHFAKRKVVIKKCHQYFIDDYFGGKLYAAFTIKTGEGDFTTEGIDILSLGMKKVEDKYLKFINGKKSFNILYDFRQNDDDNILIIYAEYILYNNTDITLSVSSKDKESNNLCFGIGKNISLITSKFDYKEAWLQLINQKFFTNPIKISSLIEKSPYSEVVLANGKGQSIMFNIKKKFSNLSIINNPSFKVNIMSLIFTIHPSCIITNLLPNKRFYICDFQQHNNKIINPYQQSNFHFFGNGKNSLLGISVLDMDNDKCSHLIKFIIKSGIYTFSTFEDIFNLEVRKNPSNGCIDVYVIQNNLENSKIIVENLSGEEISMYQQHYEKYTQIFANNDIQALKIFDPTNHIFNIETGNTACFLDIKDMEEKEKERMLNKKILLLIQANGIKMKLIFYNANKYKRLNSLNIHSSFLLRINSILVSLIADNEFQIKKLSSYKRYEVLYILFNEFSIKITVEKLTGVLNKYSIKSIINILNFIIYNQVSEKGKFPYMLKNSDAFLSLYNEIDYFDKLKIVKLNSNKIVISKLELGIDPQFLIEIIDFFGNILYRMNITNFFVNEIFQYNQENKNKQDEISSLIQEYNQTKILLNAKTFVIPNIIIRFELTSIGMKDLFKKKIGCSTFYYWLAKGLVGRAHTLNLVESIHPYNNGGLGYFFKDVFYHIRSNFENKLVEMGVKGFVGQIKNFFSFGNNNFDNLNSNRFRLKRAFYGKFQYFKEYFQQDAFFIDAIYTRHKYLKNSYYPLRLIYGFKQLYFFTNISLLIIDYKTYNILKELHYFYIKDSKADKSEVTIEFSQKIDKKDNYVIKCEDETYANNISNSLNEEIINNKEEAIDI